MADLVLGADAGQPDRTISIPAPAPTAAPSPQDIFDRMADRVAQTPALVQQVRAVSSSTWPARVAGSGLST
jgi:hypothetical protein